MDFDKFKSTVNQARDKLDMEGSSLGSKIASFSKDKVRATAEKILSEFSQFAPVLEDAGFIIGDIQLKLSIPPSLIFIVEQAEEGSLAKLEEILENRDMTRTQRTIVSLIKQAYTFDDIVEKYGHVIGQIEIEFSVPPSVTMHLNSKRSRVFSNVSEASDPKPLE